MTTKARILQIVEEMPEDLTIEDFLEQLEFRLHVDEGLRQAEAGDVITHEEMKERFAKWLK